MLRVLILPCLVLLAACGAVHAEPFETTADVALLIDVGTGAVLFDKNADQRIEAAAMAKMMTVAVVADAIKSGAVTLATQYPVSDSAWRKGGGPSGSAAMFAALKSRIAVSDLLRGVMIDGGNDACLVLAEGVAGSEAAFVARMNGLAARIGLAQTHFANATGLADPAEGTTARDLARLAQNLIDGDQQIYGIYGEKDFLWNKIRQRNRNPLIGYEGADGLATGASDAAGLGLVGSAVRGGRRLILVLHGLKTAKDRADEARRMLDWGFSAFKPQDLFQAGETIGAAQVFGGIERSVPLVAGGPVRVMAERDDKTPLTASIRYIGPVPAPVKAGTPIGTLQIMHDQTLVLDVPLKAAADVPVGTLSQRALGAAVEVSVGLVYGRGTVR